MAEENQVEETRGDEEEEEEQETRSPSTRQASRQDDDDDGDDVEFDEEDVPAADDSDDFDDDEDEEADVTYVDGPAIFTRTKEGRRRNPRHVGSDVNLDEIDYKNIQVLSRFVDNRGRIYSRRKTRVSAKMQRKVTQAIKRARHLALMPYTGEHVRITRKRSS